jgi:hypothetical protein
VAVFIRTDLPAAPGTASRSIAYATTTTTTTASVNLRITTISLSRAGYSGDYYDLTSVNLNLTRRSMVIVVGVLLLAYADEPNVVGLNIAISNIGEPAGYDLRSTPYTYVVYYNLVRPPGSYTIALRLRNGDSTMGHDVYMYGMPEPYLEANVLGYLVVYVVPLE